RLGLATTGREPQGVDDSAVAVAAVVDNRHNVGEKEPELERPPVRVRDNWRLGERAVGQREATADITVRLKETQPVTKPRQFTYELGRLGISLGAHAVVPTLGPGPAP